MRRALLAFPLLVAGSCIHFVEPVPNPSTHDMTIVTTGYLPDIDVLMSESNPGWRTAHDSGGATIEVDLTTTAAHFQHYGPCNVTAGHVAVRPTSVSGKFEDSNGGPYLEMSGLMDSTQMAMAGTWQCQTGTRGPHHQSYRGTFTLKRRP